MDRNSYNHYIHPDYMQKIGLHCLIKKLDTFPSPHLALITLLSLAGTLILMITLGTIDNVLTAPPPHYSIIDFEFAFTAEKAGEIIKTWGPTLQEAAHKSLVIDFAYLVTYALFMSSLALLVTRSLKGAHIGSTLAVMPWVAALLDAVENVCLLYTLGAQSGVIVFLSGVCALIKFVLVSIVVGFIIIGGGYLLINRIFKAR